MISFPHYLLTAWHTDIPFYLLLDWDVDVLTEKVSDLLTLTWFVTEWMTCLDCIVLVDCMSVLVYFLVYLLWTLWWISNPPCIAQTARGWGGEEVRYYLSAPRSMGSFESQSISFEAGRVIRIRKQQFRVLVWHTRNHLVLTFINELWELARRISIFITLGVKEVHSIKKKGLG